MAFERQEKFGYACFGKFSLELALFSSRIFVSLISFAKLLDGKSDLNCRKRAKDAKEFEI